MPAGNRHLPVVETRRLPLHNAYNVKCKALRAVSRLIAADGSLLFIVQVQYERHDTGNRAQSPKDSQQCRSHMYFASLGKISREGCIHASIPLPRDDRQPSFTAHRLQRRKKLDLDGGLPLKTHYTVFCRFVKQIEAFAFSKGAAGKNAWHRYKNYRISS